MASVAGSAQMPDPVLLVDDFVRGAQSLGRLLEKRWRRPYVALASYEDVVAAIESGRRFGAAVIDLSLRPRDNDAAPDWLGLELVERLLARQPGTPTVVLTGHLSGDIVHAVQKTGAFYAQKGDNATKRIEDLLGPLLSASAQPVTFEEVRAAVGEMGAQLSGAELDILTRGVRGFTVEEIAEQRGVSLQTVRNQTPRIVDKLRVGNFGIACTRVMEHATRGR